MSTKVCAASRIRRNLGIDVINFVVDVANAAVNVAAFGIEKAVQVTTQANKQEQQQAQLVAAQQQQQQQLQATGWQLPPGAGVPQMVGTGPMFVGQLRPQR